MKVFIKIKNHNITMMNFIIPPLASRGWKSLAQRICDQIIDYKKTNDGYEIRGEISSKEQLKQRLFILKSEDQQRLQCVAYAHPHPNNSTLYYDQWYYNDEHLVLMENQTYYKDDYDTTLPYKVRVWLNDGRYPDQDEYRYSAYYTVEDIPKEYELATEDDGLDITSEEYVAAMHHLWD